MALIISSIRDYCECISTVFGGLRLMFMFGGAIKVEGKKILGGMQRTIGGHVKCSVRSMFSCCFALAILLCLFEVLLVYPAKCLALLRRASVVFTCDWGATGRLLLARALAQIWRYACCNTDGISKCGADTVKPACISKFSATCLRECLEIYRITINTRITGARTILV